MTSTIRPDDAVFARGKLSAFSELYPRKFGFGAKKGDKKMVHPCRIPGAGVMYEFIGVWRYFLPVLRLVAEAADYTTRPWRFLPAEDSASIPCHPDDHMGLVIGIGSVYAQTGQDEGYCRFAESPGFLEGNGHGLQ